MNRFDALMPRVWQVLRAKQDLRARVRERDDQRRYLRIRDAATPDTAEMMIYDEIGLCGVTAMDVADQLADVTAPNLHVRINSPGGDVFDSIAIYNALLDHPAKVKVTVDGLAASGASIIAMAGDHVTMNRAAQMMIHDAYTMTIGNEADLRDMADLLSRSSDAIAGVYADRAGGLPAEWRARMRQETWYSPQEAVDARLAHATTGAKPAEQVPAYNLAASVFFFAGRAAAPRPTGAATGTHHTDTEGSAWDGPAAVAAMPNDAKTLKACHAWVDPDGDPTAKASYKFPHHRKAGGPANLAACRNGLARLSSANIPDSDRAGVKAHLQAHLDDASTSGDSSNRLDPPVSDPSPDAPRFALSAKEVRRAIKEGMK